jgi:hypothetical protein
MKLPNNWHRQNQQAEVIDNVWEASPYEEGFFVDAMIALDSEIPVGSERNACHRSGHDCRDGQRNKETHETIDANLNRFC